MYVVIMQKCPLNGTILRKQLLELKRDNMSSHDSDDSYDQSNNLESGRNEPSHKMLRVSSPFPILEIEEDMLM